MKTMAWYSFVLLMIGGCATPGPADNSGSATAVAPTAAASMAAPASSAAPPAGATWSTSTVQGVGSKFIPADVSPTADESWSIEARVVLQAVPEAAAAPGARTLKAEYASKAALVDAVKTIRPGTAVDLDGENVWAGFGPAMRYRTGADGAIRR